ncbi:hypothetical protein VPH35_116808 [Triticum aestivum]
MARGDHLDDDDDFMELLRQNRATRRTTDGDEKKKRNRNRASQERLTILTEGFTDDQKGAAAELGMQALMDVRCKNLVNPVCDWLGEIYEPASREFVIPGRGRLPLDEESVFCMLGVPCGEIKVPYEVNNTIEETLFAHLFPGMTSMPNTTVLANSLEGMKTHGEVFKMKLLMYLISSVFALTTSLRPSNKCFPILVNDVSLLLHFFLQSFDSYVISTSCLEICVVQAKLKEVKNMNWCKFIADFLHDAFLNKMYQKGCRLHLMLMYVDRLDLSTVDFTRIGGPPPPHKFVVSAWTYDAVKVVLAVDKITDTKYGKLQLMAKHAIDYSVFGGPQNFGKWMDVHSALSCPVEHLIGQFASGMTSLLGKLVEGWMSLNGSDSDAVARHFTPFVAERTHRPTGCRGRYNYNSSQELPDTQDELDGDAALDKDDDDDMENVHHDTDDDEHVEVRAGGKKGKGAPDVPSPEKVKEHTVARGKGVSPSKRGRDPEDVGQGSPVKRPRTDPLAARRSEATAGGRAVTKKQAPTPTRVSARLNKGAPIAGDTPSTRSSPRTSTPNTGDPAVLPDLRKTVKKVKKTTTRVTKQNPRDPLERIHSKLSTGGTSDVHEAPVDKPVAAATAEILPTLLAMKDAVVSHATRSASVEVDAPEINLSKEDSRSSDTDSKCVGGGTSSSTKEGAEATVHNDMPSIGETLGTTAPASGAPEVAKVTVARAGLPPRRRSPRKQSADIPNTPAVARSSRDDSGYVPASTLFPPPARSNVMERTEDRSTTDPGGKPGMTDGGERAEQTASLPAVDNPSLNLRTSKLPVNIGVPYSPNKKIVKKAATDTADSTPRPTNKPDDSAAADAEMFVDLSPLDSAQQVVRGPASRQERHPMAFTPPSCRLGIDRSQDEPVVQDPSPVAFAFPAGMAPMMVQPMVEGKKAVKFAEPVVQATPEEITPSLDEAYRRIEERRVVHAPPADDYEPEVKATKDQNQLHDIVKRFGNARSNSNHMKELKASCLDRTKIIQCDATYVDLGDLAESVRPLGKMSKNVVACGIDFINRHMDMSPDKTIMQYIVTCKIWDGDFHHKILRKHFAAHGDFKLTMKKCMWATPCFVTAVSCGNSCHVLFPMFQELAPHDPHDKCGHHYAICLDLKNQRFEVLDSMRSEADADLTTHGEYFINNLKETWNRHYENSKVQIRHFPIEYVATMKQGNRHDCGFHMLEYLAKWEGRRVPVVTAGMVVELRKIYTWNWLMNEDFNTRSNAREFIEEAVKKATKKYK